MNLMSCVCGLRLWLVGRTPARQPSKPQPAGGDDRRRGWLSGFHPPEAVSSRALDRSIHHRWFGSATQRGEAIAGLEAIVGRRGRRAAAGAAAAGARRGPRQAAAGALVAIGGGRTARETGRAGRVPLRSAAPPANTRSRVRSRPGRDEFRSAHPARAHAIAQL